MSNPPQSCRFWHGFQILVQCSLWPFSTALCQPCSISLTPLELLARAVQGIALWVEPLEWYPWFTRIGAVALSQPESVGWRWCRVEERMNASKGLRYCGLQIMQCDESERPTMMVPWQHSLALTSFFVVQDFFFHLGLVGPRVSLCFQHHWAPCHQRRRRRPPVALRRFLQLKQPWISGFSLSMDFGTVVKVMSRLIHGQCCMEAPFWRSPVVPVRMRIAWWLLLIGFVKKLESLIRTSQWTTSKLSSCRCRLVGQCQPCSKELKLLVECDYGDYYVLMIIRFNKPRAIWFGTWIQWLHQEWPPVPGKLVQTSILQWSMAPEAFWRGFVPMSEVIGPARSIATSCFREAGWYMIWLYSTESRYLAINMLYVFFHHG